MGALSVGVLPVGELSRGSSKLPPVSTSLTTASGLNEGGCESGQSPMVMSSAIGSSAGGATAWAEAGSA